MATKNTLPKKITSGRSTNPTNAPAVSQPVEQNDNDFIKDLYNYHMKQADDEIETLRKQLRMKTKSQIESAAEIERLKYELTKLQEATAKPGKEQETINHLLRAKEEHHLTLLDIIAENQRLLKWNTKLKEKQRASRWWIVHDSVNHSHEQHFKDSSTEEDKQHAQEETEGIERRLQHNLQEMEDKEKELLRLEAETQELTEQLEHAQHPENQPEDTDGKLGELTSANSIEESHNVADLYDKNCPKDLADNFSETYENEWADALIELTDQKSYAEEEAIRILFDIFQDAYGFSNKQVAMYFNSVSEGMKVFGLDNHEKWPLGVTKLVKDHMKSLSVLVAGNVSKEFLKNQNENYGNATSIYAEACAELCLFMCVQSPAFFLDFSTPKGKFDKERFTVYTKSGDEYAFPVWPPLYLYKEGPMIGKGIAQGL